MYFEGWGLSDSLYVTVITLSTVGCGELQKVSPAGRIFTVFLIPFGIFIITCVAGAVARTLIEGEIRSILERRKLDKKIKPLKNHYIICGYGRIGRIVYGELASKTHTASGD